MDVPPRAQHQTERSETRRGEQRLMGIRQKKGTHRGEHLRDEETNDNPDGERYPRREPLQRVLAPRLHGGQQVYPESAIEGIVSHGDEGAEEDRRMATYGGQVCFPF